MVAVADIQEVNVSDELLEEAPEGWLKTDAAAPLYGLSRSGLRNWIYEGRIPGCKVKAPEGSKGYGFLWYVAPPEPGKDYTTPPPANGVRQPHRKAVQQPMNITELPDGWVPLYKASALYNMSADALRERLMIGTVEGEKIGNQWWVAPPPQVQTVIPYTNGHTEPVADGGLSEDEWLSGGLRRIFDRSIADAEEIGRLRQQVSGLTSAIAALGRGQPSAESAAELEALRAELEETKLNVLLLEDELKASRDREEGLKSETAASQTNAAQFRATIERQNDRIRELEKTAALVAELQRSVQEYKNMIAEMREARTNLEARMEALKAENAKLQVDWRKRVAGMLGIEP